MAEAKTKGGKAGRILVWGLLGLLIVGLAGFGVGSFGGRASTVGSVGDRDITAQAYFRALEQAVRARQRATGQAVTLEQARATGLLEQVQGQMVTAAALDGEADRLGLSVGDETVAEQVLTQPAFTGMDGEFDREAYEFALRQNGWTVPEFEDEIRRETARALLQTAAAGGTAAPDALIDVIVNYVGERRSLSWVRFDTLEEPLPAPTEADLRTFYEANEDDFTLPEMRRITYAWLTPDMLLDEAMPDDAAIRALYEDRIDQYVRPERRLVERLVFETEADAQEAMAAIEAGETTFPALVEARDLTLADVDLGEVTARDLGPAADGVFALEEPGVTGPHPTDLGPALFRVNALLSASETPFEEVREELGRELGRDRARRMVEDRISELDDRLAAGATLEDLAAETEMELGQIDYWEGATAPIADYAGFRRAATTASEDDFPQVETLEDGSIFALRLDEVLPPRLQPLEEVRQDVARGWRQETRLTRLRAQAEAARARLETGATLEDAGEVDSVAEVRRDDFIGGTPPALLERAFALEDGETAIVEGSDSVFLVRLDAIVGPDPDDAELASIRQVFAQSAQQALTSDLLTYYARALTAEAGIRFDEAALNAVHTQVFR